MDNVEPNPTNPRHSLDYARNLQADARLSKLAVFALVLSMLGSPCLLGPILGWLNWRLPMQYQRGGLYGFWQPWTMLGTMTLAAILSATAAVRIRRSRGVLLGATIAWIGLFISLLWWLPILLFSMPMPH